MSSAIMTDRQAILQAATKIFVSRENLDWEKSVEMALEIWERSQPPEEGATTIGERKSSRDAHAALRRIGIAVGVEESDNPYEEIPEAVEARVLLSSAPAPEVVAWEATAKARLEYVRTAEGIASEGETRTAAPSELDPP